MIDKRNYRQEDAALAKDFRDEAKRVVDHARRFPQAGPVIDIIDGLALRHFLFRPRFPYMLIGCATNDALVVFAVAHQSQRPGYWKTRLAKARP